MALSMVAASKSTPQSHARQSTTAIANPTTADRQSRARPRPSLTRLFTSGASSCSYEEQATNPKFFDPTTGTPLRRQAPTPLPHLPSIEALRVYALENLNSAGIDAWNHLEDRIVFDYLEGDETVTDLDAMNLKALHSELAHAIHILVSKELYQEYHVYEYPSPSFSDTDDGTDERTEGSAPPASFAFRTPTPSMLATHDDSCSDDGAPDDAPRPVGPLMDSRDALLVDQVPTDKPSYEEWREERIGQMRDEYDTEYCAWQAAELDATRTQQDNEYVHQREDAIAWREDELDPGAYAVYHDPVPQDAPPDDWGDPGDTCHDHESQDVPPDDWGDPDGDHYSEDERGHGDHYSDGYYSEDDRGFGLSANDGRDDYYED
jgi:hypothetical protein